MIFFFIINEYMQLNQLSSLDWYLDQSTIQPIEPLVWPMSGSIYSIFFDSFCPYLLSSNFLPKQNLLKGLKMAKTLRTWWANQSVKDLIKCKQLRGMRCSYFRMNLNDIHSVTAAKCGGQLLHCSCRNGAGDFHSYGGWKPPTPMPPALNISSLPLKRRQWRK